MLETIIENYPDVEFLKADGFDDAVIGVVTDFVDEPKLIYSVSKCLAILMGDDEMDDSDALEYFTFNVSGAYVGPKTPIWCWDDF
jgi:hypothetical protein